MHFAGITVGYTTDSQVQRLLGKGVFRPDEGHTGGRCYIDSKHTATLHVIEGVDQVVEELTLRSGINSNVKQSELRLAESDFVDAKEGFGNWHALHLGSTKDEALANLGAPKGKVSSNEWVYETSCACELPQEFTLVFKQGRIVEMKMYAGE